MKKQKTIYHFNNQLIMRTLESIGINKQGLICRDKETGELVIFDSETGKLSPTKDIENIEPVKRQTTINIEEPIINE